MNEHRDTEKHYGGGPNRPDLCGLVIPGRRGRLLGTLYTAAGEGLHPVVLLLHGIPGNEQNADLAQALRRAGFSVLLFHYSGSWGSDGSYSFAHDLEDANTVLDYILADESHDFDTARIFAVGHSLGGFACAHLAASRPEIRAAAILMPCDVGGVYLARDSAPEVYRLLYETLGESVACLNGTSLDALLSELSDSGEDYALRSTAEALAQKPLLLAAASLDECTPPETHAAPLALQIRALGGKKLQQAVFPTDHFAADYRLELARTLVSFFTEQAGI